MPARSVRDSITDRHGHRLKVNVDKSSGEIEYPYSSGATIVTRPSGPEIRTKDGRLVSNGSKEVVIAKGPHSLWTGSEVSNDYRDNYSRVFGHDGPLKETDHA